MFNQHHFDIATRASEESDSLDYAHMHGLCLMLKLQITLSPFSRRYIAWNWSLPNRTTIQRITDARNIKHYPMRKHFIKHLPTNFMTVYVCPNEPIHWPEKADAVMRDFSTDASLLGSRHHENIPVNDA
ncbi:hypothetical protein ARMGADRAFT_300064 [Armillaria gallica]|uniref:Uncharacterized protein n=1 Tax=Armillaria gallica TaxID=47427 RepID=A0A2H3DNA8_ARMGA|nr:hypothetical protein ARMGADRAFT_300064 [Armillaria gallica]